MNNTDNLSGISNRWSEFHDRLSRACPWLIASCLLLGSVRAFMLINHKPVYGYANNFDFRRVTEWYGIWPTTLSDDKKAGSPSAPMSKFKMGSDGCFSFGPISSELIFVDLAVKLSVLRNILLGVEIDQFRIRILGLVKLIAVIAISIWSSYRLFRISASAGLASAVVFALVVCDPVNTLYFNSFYSYSSALIFTYLSVSALMILLLSPASDWVTTIVFACSLLFLGLSRYQQFLLPLVLAGLFISCCRLRHTGRVSRDLRCAALAVVASVTAILIQVKDAARPGFMQAIVAANAADTFLFSVLPAMNDQTGAMKALGLPDYCSAYIGKSWYSDGMQPLPCPEVARVSRSKLLGLMVQQPGGFLRLFSQAVHKMRPAIIKICGHVEGGHFTYLDFSFPLGHWSIHQPLDALPFTLYFLILLFVTVVFLISVFRLFGRPWKRDARGFGMHILQVVTYTILIYAIVSSVFGDGLFAISQHVYLGHVALPVCLISSGAIVTSGLLRRVNWGNA